ncbi:MAG: hypothetical protein WBA88_17090 [Pseudaminobacter sp.]
MTDWLEILKQQNDEGKRMGRQVPKMLSDPAITADQVKALFDALEKQADFIERLVKALEQHEYDFDIVKAAEKLEERYMELAAQAAERLKEMRGH